MMKINSLKIESEISREIIMITGQEYSTTLTGV